MDRHIEQPDPTVSHRHAELAVYAGSIPLVDLGSARGTHVLAPDGRHRLHERVVAPDTAVESGRCRRTVAELPAAAQRRATGRAA